MSTSDNNLLNFLQKQSLFNNSPTKNANRKMSSRSREKRSEQLWQGGANTNLNQNQNFTAPNNFNTNATFTVGQNNANTTFTTGQSSNTFIAGQSNANTLSGGQLNNSFTTGQTNAATFNAGQNQNFNSGQNLNFQASIQQNNAQVHFQNPIQFGSNVQGQQQQFGHAEFKVQTKVQSPIKPPVPIIQTSFQNNSNSFNGFSTNLKVNETGNTVTTYNSYQQEIIKHPGSRLDANAQDYLQNVVTYAVDSTNYARNEAMKRLDILAEKVRIQLSSLNSKLEGFNSQMMSIVISEFNFVKSKVYEILEETFRENEKYCRGYISTIETEFNEDVLKARAALQRESENIALMKVDINKPHWQNNAVFVSVEFQARVNNVVNQVKGLEVKTIQQHTNQSWQMNLKRDLLDRVINRLQRERELAFGKHV